jgi:hypothetical protein
MLFRNGAWTEVDRPKEIGHAGLMSGQAVDAGECKLWPTYVIQIDPASIFEPEIQQPGHRNAAYGLVDLIGWQFEEGSGSS